MTANWEQLDLFPIASLEEIRETKRLLEKYHKLKLIIRDFEQHHTGSSTIQQKKRYDYCIQVTQRIDRAVNLILDSRIKQIIEHRYIEGNSNKMTVARFGGNTPRTVDRNLYDGIESVANTLRMLEEL